MGMALEELERPSAEERRRQKPGGKQGEKVSSGKLPEETLGQTREIVGAAVGMSGTTYMRAKAMVAARVKKQLEPAAKERKKRKAKSVSANLREQNGKASDDAGKLLNVSGRSVDHQEPIRPAEYITLHAG